jgi:hypothetical protein
MTATGLAVTTGTSVVYQHLRRHQIAPARA